jgi:alpha-beta hydrolase superfamily lysophospholipase
MSRGPPIRDLFRRESVAGGVPDSYLLCSIGVGWVVVILISPGGPIPFPPHRRHMAVNPRLHAEGIRLMSTNGHGETVAGASTVSSTVRSADGTLIAFERSGHGHPVILISSALADHRDAGKLARLLAYRFTVINYDRRGRGASADAARYAVEREVEDIAALVDLAGGTASLFGSSSGALLALRAASAGLDIARLALYEPPLPVPGGFRLPQDCAARIDSMLAEGRRSDAVKYFMTEVQGAPAAMVAVMRLMPGVWRNLTGLAHTLPYDTALLAGSGSAGTGEARDWTAVTAPTLVLTGGKSAPGFRAAAEAITAVLPAAEHRSLPGLSHGAVVMAPKKLAPAVVDFLAG